MKQIQLTQGRVALVDDEDFDQVSKYRWYCGLDRWRAYAISGFGFYVNNTRKRITVRMHRLIMNAGRGQEVDHINGNGLDNRKGNLRLCTKVGNGANRRSAIGSSSKYLGVSGSKTRKSWLVQIQSGGMGMYLGVYASEVEAAKAYDVAARKYHGEFARLNFPGAEHGS